MREKLIEMAEQLQYCATDYDCTKCKRLDEVSENNCVDDLLAKAAELMKIAANGVTIAKWIPVTERLPEVVDSYLVVIKAKYDFETEYEIDVDVATYNPYEKSYIDDCWNTYNDWDEGQQYLHVTHWMPLPQPPKGE